MIMSFVILSFKAGVPSIVDKNAGFKEGCVTFSVFYGVENKREESFVPRYSPGHGRGAVSCEIPIITHGVGFLLWPEFVRSGIFEARKSMRKQSYISYYSSQKSETVLYRNCVATSYAGFVRIIKYYKVASIKPWEGTSKNPISVDFYIIKWM